MKYNELFKRAIAMVMCLTMTVSMLPVSALAQEAHTHADTCYTERVVCGVEEGAVHAHGDSCYTVKNHTVCGLVETEGHNHVEACYKTEDSLTCTLEATQGHAHSEACREQQRSLSCGKEESEDHAHDDSCYKVESVLKCGKTEKAPHAHGEGCYEPKPVLKCTKQAQAHTHVAACWKEGPVLTCTKSTEPHVHTDACKKATLTCEFAEAEDGGEEDKTGEGETAALSVTLTSETETLALGKSLSVVLTISGGKAPYAVELNGEQKEAVEAGTHTYTLTPAEVGTFTANVKVTDAKETAKEAALSVNVENNSDNESNPDAYAQVKAKVDALPAVDAVAAMSDEEKAALVEQLIAIGDELDALLDAGTVTMEQYEALTVQLMQLNEAIIGTEAVTLELQVYVGDTTQTNRIDKDTLKLYYEKPKGTWNNIEEGTPELTGEENLQLAGKYFVSRADLIAAGGEFRYQLPSYLRNIKITPEKPTTFEVVNGSQKTTVSMTVMNGVATFHFADNWQNVLTADVVSGDFTMSGQMDASGFQGGDNVIDLGRGPIHIKLPEDIQGKYSNVTVTKAAQKLFQPGMAGYSLSGANNGKSYILYSVQVKGDPEKVTEGVSVVDSITNTGNVINKPNGGGQSTISFKERYFDGFAGVTGTETEISAIADVEGSQGTVKLTESDNSSITWNVGTVGANETKYLTYKVIVKDTYVGFAHGKSGDGSDADGGSFENKAEVYAGHYKRNEATAHYTPKGNLSVAKRADAPKFNPDTNQYEIKYHLTASAPADNSYTMTAVKLNDVLTTSGFNAEKVKYDTASLKLWDAQGHDITDTIPTPDNLLYRTKNPEVGQRSMTVIIGDLKPGESKTLTYNAVVPVEVFLNYNVGQGVLKNTAEIYDDEVKDPVRYGSKLGQANITHTLDLKHWGGKFFGDVSDTPKTVSITGADAYYDATGAGVTSAADHPASFTVPAKNIEYKLVVNQTGDWDVSGAAIHDQLSQNTTDQVIRYAGWVRVNAYNISDEQRSSLSGNIADAAAYNTLNAMSPVKTVWVKVEDLTTFQFSPKQIGMTNPNLAYTLNYYTYTKTQEFTKVSISNGFKLTGNVGVGGKTYQIGWGGASISKTIVGSVHFGYEKKAWYYDYETASNFDKGQLYWYIKASSNTGEIHEGTQIKDAPEVGGTNKAHTIVNGQSVLGVYLSSTPVTAYTDFASFAAAAQSLEGKYTTTYAGSGTGANAVVTFTEDIPLTNSQNIYIIVRTAPSVLPNDESVSSMNYANKAYAKHGSESNFDNGVSASQQIRTGYSLAKSTNGLFKIVNNQVTAIAGNANTIVTNLSVGGQNYHYTDGVYISWQINLSDMAAGSYTVEDVLPSGVELAYVRKVSGTATGYTANAGTAHTCTAGNETAVYYTDGSQIRLYFPQIAEKGTAVYQVVARVVDPDILQGGAEKELVNHANLFPGDTVEGARLTNAAAPVTVSVDSISKNYDTENIQGTRIPFTVVANENGLDLNPNGNTLTMVDKMSKSLRFDAQSLVVKDTAGGTLTQSQSVSDTTYTVSYDTSAADGNILKITIPDDKKLIITYNCTVNYVPGTPVGFSNDAYWEGYPDGGNSAGVENFVSTGTVTAHVPAEIKIAKMNDGLTMLSGATFKMYKLPQVLDESNHTITVSATTLSEQNLVDTQTTDTDGIARFQDVNKVLYNTVYALVETEAPAGYVLDSTPHYVVVLENLGDSVHPVFCNIANLTNSGLVQLPGLVVESSGNILSYNAYNHKGSVTVTKNFLDVNGNVVNPVADEFTFGIWEDDGSHVAKGMPLTTKSIAWAEGETEEKSVTFTDLDASKTYIICELDDTLSPIASNTVATVNGASYRVVYPQGNLASNFQSPVVIRVSNKEPGRISTSIHAFKTLNNQPSGGFSIEVIDNNGTIDRSGIVTAVPERNTHGATLITSTFNADGELSLDLSNMVSFIKAGVYRYKVRELYNRENGDTQNGLTYDSRVYDVTITVSENAQGHLSTVTRYTLNGANVDAIRFANTYNAVGTAQIKAIKHLSGRDWKDDDSFNFKLVATNGAPLRKVITNGSTETAVNVDELTATATKTAREMDFGRIQFTNADLGGAAEKTFYYRISETGDYPGITKPADRIVAIKVRDVNHNGQLSISYAAYDNNGSLTNEYLQTIDAPDLINIYSTSPVSATIKATKSILDKDGNELEDWKCNHGQGHEHDWSANEFYFQLERTREATPMPAGTDGNIAVAKVSQKTAEWGAIEFDKPGEYDYIIRELTNESGTLEPVTETNARYESQKLLYEVAVHSAKVIVTDKLDGTLSADVVYYRGSSSTGDSTIPIFKNRELPDTYVNLQVEKQLTGMALRDGEFSFELYHANAQGEVDGPAIKNASVVVTDSTANKGLVKFGALTYQWSSFPNPTDLPHVDYYVIREKARTGVTNTTGDIRAKVTVSAGEHDELHTAVEYAAKVNGTWTTVGSPVMENEYASSGTAQLTASKHIVGRDFWNANESFTFTLTPVGDAPLRIMEETEQGGTERKDKTSLSATATAAEKIVSFDQLQFIQSDMNDQTTIEYTYIIHEERPNGYSDTDGINGMTYAADVTVKIRLTDDGKGNITAEYKLGNRHFTNVAMNAQFDNVYTLSPIEAELKATKRLTGRQWLDTDTFTFEVIPIGNTAGYTVAAQPMPTSATVNVTKQSTATAAADSFTASFGAITYTKPGLYVYDIREDIPGERIPGVTYSTAEHRVTVGVVDNGDGTMKATVLYAGTNSDTPATFTNTYAPGETSLAIVGRKTLQGRELIARQYNFSLYNTDESFAVASGTAPVFTGAANANGSIDQYTLTFTQPGTYYYVLRENIPAGAAEVDGKKVRDGITFDTHDSKITVTVVDNLDGTMTASAVYDNASAPADADKTVTDMAAFTNVYKATGSVQMQVTKQITSQLGWDYVPEFGFRLTPGENAPFNIKDANGELFRPDENALTATATKNYVVASFDRLWFSEEDIGKVYQYTIEEILPDGINQNNYVHNSITYNHEKISVLVRVEDGGTGNLNIAVSYNGESSATIINRFERVEVAGFKTWIDTDADKTHENSTEIALKLYRTSQKANSEPELLANVVPEWVDDTYIFRDLTKYDAEGYEYIYSIEETRVDGYYTGIVNGYDITNKVYTAQGSITLTGTKVLSGGRLTGVQADEFTFVVKDAGGNTVSTGKTASDGSITFSPIVYTQADLGENQASKTYTYTVSEVVGTDKSITYSTEHYQVIVDVSAADQTFTSTSEDAHKLNISVSYKNSSGELVSSPAFHNTFNSGSLKISKTVTGDLGDKDKEFTFKVTLSCAGSYPYTGSNTGTISSGETVKLKHGQSITITNLPVGATYTVTESDNSGYTVKSTGDTGTIAKDTTSAASFTNSKSSVPKTGDQSNFTQWIAAMFVCLAGAAAAMFFVLKRRSHCKN